MSIIELFLIACGLSMDAMAASICKGLSAQRMDWKKAVLVGIWFGGFQALMPAAGYLLGAQFEGRIAAFDHWIAFALLGMIGAGMIREGKCPSEEQADASVSVKSMLPMAVATSSDALAVGVTFACLQVELLPAAALIGWTTFALSVLGVKLGALFGSRYRSRAEIAGGVLLIIMGVKILIEHLAA